MGSSEKVYDLTILLLIVGGGLMFFTNLFGLVWSGQFGVVLVHPAFQVVEVAGSLGGLFVIALAVRWNEDYTDLFTFIVVILGGISIAFGFYHANSSYYGLAFGGPILLSGVLVSLGGGTKFFRHRKELTPRTSASTLGRPSRPEISVRKGKDKEPKIGVKLCTNCKAELPIDAIFCVECGTSQEAE